MRKIPSLPIILFLILSSASIAIGYIVATLSTVSLGVLAVIVISLVIYRLLALMYPVREAGYTEKNIPLAYEVQLLYDLFFFFIVSSLHILPVPLTRLYMKTLGMKIGKNSYPGFTEINNPIHFISAGDNVVFGTNSIITPHTYESNGRLTIKPIRIGNNVTIGMNSVILPGVTVEDGAVVAAGAVVTKNTHIKRGEIWGGIPARKIKDGLPTEEKTTPERE